MKTSRASARLWLLIVLLGLVVAPVRVAPLGAAAQRGGHWIPLGPGGGRIRALALDPLDERHLYASPQRGGVYVSEDAAASWKPMSAGLGDRYVLSLAASPGRAGLVFAGTLRGGLFVSEDGGGHWKRAGLPGLVGDLVQQVVFDRVRPQTVYVGTTSGFFRSDDEGATWTDLTGTLPPFPDFRDLIVHPAAQGELYGAIGAGVVRSTDGGLSWRDSSAGLPPNHFVSALALDLVLEDVYVAVVGTEGGVFRSSDGGASWLATAPVPSTGSSSGAITLAADPRRGGVVWVGSQDRGVFRSFDGGESWEPDASLGEATIYALAVGPRASLASAGATLYAGDLGGGGVFRSVDDGEHWEPRNLGLSGVEIASVVPDSNDPDRLLVGTIERGVLLSEDAGGQWEERNQGLPPRALQLLGGDPSDADTLLVSTAPTVPYDPDEPTLYRSTDGARSWQAVREGPYAVRSLVFAPHDGRLVYAASADFGSLDRSLDGGLTWTRLPAPGVFVDGVALAGPERLFLAGHTMFYDFFPPYFPEGRIYESRDGGETFERIGEEIESTGAGPIWVDSRNTRRLFVALQTGLLKSVDGGRSFRPSGLASSVVRDLAFDPSEPGRIYAGTADGVFVSRDRGGRWTPLSRGLASLSVRDLAFGAGTPPVLWAGTDGGGVHRLEREPAPSLCEPDATRLCLHDGRFEIEVVWETADGASGLGRALPLDAVVPDLAATGNDTGFFWFFSRDNVEMALKILDGTALNGHYWLFFATLSDVATTIRVSDRISGGERSWRTSPGRFSSVADVEALPAGPTRDAKRGPTSRVSAKTAADLQRAPPPFVEGGPDRIEVAGAPVVLQDRFDVAVTWRDAAGVERSASAVGLGDDSAYYWFFEPGNVEAVVKVLDGREVNGHYWVVYGSLTDLPLTIDVTDAESGVSRSYEKPGGTLASAADLEAF